MKQAAGEVGGAQAGVQFRDDCVHCASQAVGGKKTRRRVLHLSLR